jgi:hypothetical protein
MNLLNFIEESKLNGQGVSLVLVLIVLVCSYYTQVLTSQGGVYEKNRWAKKQANAQSANKRTRRAQEAQQRRKDEAKQHRTKVHHLKPLGSQASAQDFINLSVDASDWFLDHFGHLWLKMREIASDFHFSLPEIALSNCSIDVPKYYALFTQSDIGIKFIELLDLFVGIGWLKRIELTIKGVPLFCTNRISHRVTFPMILEKSISFAQLFMTKLMMVISTGKFESFFETEAKNAYDSEFSFLKSQKVLIDLGRGNEVDDVTYDRRLQECIDKTLSLINSCNKTERSYYSSKLAILRDIQSARTLDQKENIREKPYGILLYGDSGVGKSAIVNALVRYVLKVNNKDFSPKAVITLNQEDKYQSEFRTHHKGVILDDICNTALERTDGSPTTPIIMFLNQVPMSALNPNAEMKGQVMIEPDVVCGTTNVKDLMSNQLSNEPLSINRRFEVTITQTVKEEYRKDGSTMLDNKKIAHMAGDLFPDYATFTVEEPRYAPNTTGDKRRAGKSREIMFLPINFKGKPLVDVSIFELLEFLKVDSASHFERQREFVTAQKKNHDMPLCEHGRPCGHCAECPMESQTGIPYYSEVVDYMSNLEDRVCDWLSSMKKSLLMTQYGHMVIAYLLRDQLKSVVLNSIGYYVSILGVLLFTEACDRTPSAWRLVMLTCLYMLYIAVRFYYIRQKTIENFSHVTKPSDYFRNMSWETKRKWLGALVALGVWRILVELARRWKTLPTKQAAAPITLTPDAKPYQRETEFWDQRSKERDYQFGDAGASKVARTTTHEQMVNIIGKRLKVIIKPSGEQCNALPVKGNVVLIPNHFVPKETLYVTAMNIGRTQYQNLPLARSLCQKIPGTDLAVWYCPGLGSQKDLTEYYPKDIHDGKKLEVYTLYNDDGKLVQYPKMMGYKERIITDQGGWFSGLKYTFPQETFGGLCMATQIGTAHGIPFIASHHLAGRGTTGAGGFVTRQQLNEAIDILDKKPGVLVSHSAVPMTTKSLGVDFGPLTAPHEKCPTNELTATSKIRIHGTHNQPRASHNKSRVVTSLISASVAKIMGIEKQHGPPKEMGDKRHKELDISGKVDTAVKFDADIAQRAYVDYCARLDKIPEDELKRLGKVSDDANLAGLDGVLGVNAVNFSTSVGFPLKGPKTQFVEKSDRVVEGISCPRDVDPLIWEEVKRMEQTLLAGKSINAIFKASLKDEPTKLSKDKVRVFAAANFPFVLLVRKYYLTIAAMCQRNKVQTECAVGTVVQSPEWSELFEHIGKHGWDRAIAGDYAKFDGRMSPQFMLMAFKLMIHLAEKSGNYDADDLTIMRGIASEISYPTYDYFGTLVQFLGSNPSGHPLTVVINSMVNSLYMRYTYYMIAKQKKWWRVPLFDTVVSLMTYGDDNIMSVKKGYDDFNHTAIAKVLADVDIKYTMADKDAESVPFINLADASFLKHFAKFDPELGLYRSPVEDGSIAKMLHTHLKSDVLNMEQSSAEAIQNVALKYFEFGREVYTERVAQLQQVAEENGLTGYVGPIMDYDERLDWYREKFELESQSGYKHEKYECTVNSEEEQLQLKAIAEMPIRCTAKEYSYPGGRSGDLLFIAGNYNVALVVEVKVSPNKGKKYKRVVEQANDFGRAMSSLYPKYAVYALTYTLEGFTLQYINNPHNNKMPDTLRARFPFNM